MASASAVEREKGELKEIRKEQEHVKETVADDSELIDAAQVLVDQAEEIRVSVSIDRSCSHKQLANWLCDFGSDNTF